MPLEYFDNLMNRRTECMLYQASLGRSTKTGAGWIGGSAPEWFQQQAPLTGGEGQNYYFYMSLIHPFHRGDMISIFIPENYEAYLERNLYPHCTIKVVQHPLSMESAETLYAHPGMIKHVIQDGIRCENEEATEQSFLIKLGGQPRLIQQEQSYGAKLQEDALSFLFQIDEEGYPDILLRDDWGYPFGFGAFYVYVKINRNEVSEPVAGFWQY